MTIQWLESSAAQLPDGLLAQWLKSLMIRWSDSSPIDCSTAINYRRLDGPSLKRRLDRRFRQRDKSIDGPPTQWRDSLTALTADQLTVGCLMADSLSADTLTFDRCSLTAGWFTHQRLPIINGLSEGSRFVGSRIDSTVLRSEGWIPGWRPNCRTVDHMISIS